MRRARRASARRGSAAEGGARSVPQALRRPCRRTIRRWIAAARPDSISCSHTAQASASNGSGRRRGRIHGLRRITGPISGSQRKRRWNSVRSWSVPSAKRMRSMAAARRLPRLRLSADPHRPAGRPGPHHDLLLADPERPRERPVASDHHTVASRPREPVRPDGNDVLLERGGYRSLRRWMSTRNEREPTMSTSCRLPSRTRDRPRAPQHADHHERRDPDQEPARGRRDGGRQRHLHAPLDRAWLCEDGEVVGHLRRPMCRVSAATPVSGPVPPRRQSPRS